MKVRVLQRFVAKGRVIKHPGEIIDVSQEMAKNLIWRGIARPIDDEGQPFQTTAEYARQVQEQRAKSGCGGCGKRR